MLLQITGCQFDRSARAAKRLKLHDRRRWRVAVTAHCGIRHAASAAHVRNVALRHGWQRWSIAGAFRRPVARIVVTVGRDKVAGVPDLHRSGQFPLFRRRHDFGHIGTLGGHVVVSEGDLRAGSVTTARGEREERRGVCDARGDVLAIEGLDQRWPARTAGDDQVGKVVAVDILGCHIDAIGKIPLEHIGELPQQSAVGVEQTNVRA